MVEILADECVDIQLVFRLRRLGYRVQTVRGFSASKSGDGLDDSAVLQLAREHHLAVLTTNESDFLRLHPRFPGHYGILIVEHEKDALVQARRIDEALKQHADVRGEVVWFTRAVAAARKSRRRKQRGG